MRNTLTHGRCAGKRPEMFGLAAERTITISPFPPNATALDQCDACALASRPMESPAAAAARNPSPRDRLIVALDVPGEEPALRLVEALAGSVGLFKIGLELFTRVGPSIVARVRAAGAGAGIFLDLKFHDIPNTVERAVRSALELGVDMLTVHASGGGEMLRAAVRGAGSPERAATGPLLLGVTVLTSSTEATLLEIGVSAPGSADVVAQVVRLAQLGAGSGLGGLVASPLEIRPLRAALAGQPLALVIPGVRPAWAADAGDQKRVLTPGEAIAAGADYLVVGRPITGHRNPADAAKMIVEEITGACGVAPR